MEIQTGGGSCPSGNPGERGGLKNDSICRGGGGGVGVDFFWNNPIYANSSRCTLCSLGGFVHTCTCASLLTHCHTMLMSQDEELINPLNA